MRLLTRRGIALAARLRGHGCDVIESFPGAAQDILSIPRKRQGVARLARGLANFGLSLRTGSTHDELDAVTSAVVGLFYLAGEHEALGAPDEGCIVVPRASSYLTASSGRR
jgi:predicted nuclease with RNAse H fold